MKYSELILIDSLRSFRSLELTCFASLRYRKILYLTGSFRFDFSKIFIIEASLRFVSISLTLLYMTPETLSRINSTTPQVTIHFKINVFVKKRLGNISYYVLLSENGVFGFFKAKKCRKLPVLAPFLCILAGGRLICLL